MPPQIRKWLLFLALPLFCLSMAVGYYATLIGYGLAQGWGQARVLWNARPVEDVMNDLQFPDSLKQKIKLVGEIRHFAIHALGLKDTPNYTTIFDQKGREVMWVVMAARPFMLRPKLWSFPIVGEVPYKGFFDSLRAVQEAEALRAKGWDVDIRNPGGWSTLGWFSDPLLSGMLASGEGRLAELIIHEMVHATIFVKDSVQFNENLASFIADSAAYVFLEQRYGARSPQYYSYVSDREDERCYGNHMQRAIHQLDSLYSCFSPLFSLTERKRSKARLIQRIVEAADTLSLHAPSNPLRAHPLNNCHFITWMVYHHEQDTLRAALMVRYQGSVRAMIADYARRFPFL